MCVEFDWVCDCCGWVCCDCCVRWLCDDVCGFFVDDLFGCDVGFW